MSSVTFAVDCTAHGTSHRQVNWEHKWIAIWFSDFYEPWIHNCLSHNIISQHTLIISLFVQSTSLSLFSNYMIQNYVKWVLVIVEWCILRLQTVEKVYRYEEKQLIYRTGEGIVCVLCVRDHKFLTIIIQHFTK